MSDLGDTTDPAPELASFDRYELPEIEVLLRVARSLSGNTADAADLVQDTLIRAARRHPIAPEAVQRLRRFGQRLAWNEEVAGQ